MFETIEISPAVLDRADSMMQILCGQIHNDVQNFIKNHVIENLPESKILGWRETRALAHLHVLPQGITSARLSELTRYSAATISRINQKLIKSEFMIPEHHYYDARSIMLKITPAGVSHMDAFYRECSAQHDLLVPSLLPELNNDVLHEIIDLFLYIQRRAEKLAGIDQLGRLKGYNTTRYSRSQFEKNFQQYTQLPELLFQMFCGRISPDYLTFFKRHAIAPLTMVPKIKIRELRVLMCLEFFGEPSPSIKIAKTMRYDKATVARASAILIEDGYMFATTSLIDEREKLLWLTQKGFAAAAEYHMTSNTALSNAEKIFGESQDEEIARRCLAMLFAIRKRTKVFARKKKNKKRFAI